MTQHLSDLTHALIDAARKAGADAADAVAITDDSLSIEVLKGALEHAERSEGTAIGLRVMIGQKQASVSASDIRAEMITTLAQRAVAMAQIAPDDPWCGLAEPEALAQDTNATALDLIDDERPDPQMLEQWALEAEAAALDVANVTQTQASGAGWSTRQMHLAASNGFSAGYGRTGWSVSSVAISGEGLTMERDYYGDSRTHRSDLLSPAEIGRIAGERAVERAGASKPPTGRYPVLYDERISSGLIGHLVQASNGASVARGSSWLKDALGAQILPDGLSLTEDPHRARAGGSRPFDGEGLPTQRRDLVADGMLTGWTLDLATARQLGMTSTANAARGTGGAPSPSVGNLTLTQGDKTRDELLAEMGTGLLITSLIGSSINPTTGDYSRGASGFWVENGQIVRPVNECTVAGNLREMLMSIIPANDARLHLSRVVPSLLVEGLTIAGA
ncbi:PmbA protein [Monaibacterium marinum]|uniref:PmbA protein n=1 Tax=Pontivivens marinum TaxID=1690039 RepID=A0A2C9CNQ5_9RHOB|nr:TldD/PmbA family protein [Monaibacterium marinum]SOH92830.1 PmbA protein [Monaibacterium marinum]